MCFSLFKDSPYALGICCLKWLDTQLGIEVDSRFAKHFIQGLLGGPSLG